METIEKIKQIATKSEMYSVNIAVRTVIDEYNNQKLENWKPITYFMEKDEVKLLNELQRRTYDKFGGSGMVMQDQIIAVCGFNSNPELYKKAAFELYKKGLSGGCDFDKEYKKMTR